MVVTEILRRPQDSLELAVQRRIAQVKKEIADKQAELDRLVNDLGETRRIVFKEKYHRDADVVMKAPQL